MTTIHIGKRGEPVTCTTTLNCPFRAEEHGISKQEVQEIIDSYQKTVELLKTSTTLPKSSNPFTLAGQLKALKEFNNDKYKELAKKKPITSFVSAFGDKSMIETKINQNDKIKKEWIEYEKLAEQRKENYNQSITELKEKSSFGDRLRISGTKVFVKNIQKNEWEEYNKIKEELSKLNSAHGTGRPSEYAYSDTEIERMKEDLVKYEEKENTLDEIDKYYEMKGLEEELEESYNKYLFRERVGVDRDELKEVNLDSTVDNVYTDNKGNLTNVYLKEGKEFYKVTKINGTEYKVESLNRETKIIHRTTSWNWRMKTEAEARRELPKVYIAPTTEGTKISEPVSFGYAVYDSSD